MFNGQPSQEEFIRISSPISQSSSPYTDISSERFINRAHQLIQNPDLQYVVLEWLDNSRQLQIIPNLNGKFDLNVALLRDVENPLPIEEYRELSNDQIVERLNSYRQMIYPITYLQAEFNNNREVVILR